MRIKRKSSKETGERWCTVKKKTQKKQPIKPDLTTLFKLSYI